ncbi:MAG: SGNH/GDSL hydrolase family protein [Arenicellales bacterium]|nr:SGNH/GDSL hydrolase family protein [Arenicellales bacterium]
MNNPVVNNMVAIGCICVTLLTGAGMVEADRPPVRIMPLGDSITQGYNDSYRRPLWLALREAGWDVDFVGSMNEGYAGSEESNDYDSDHEGHWGWFANEVLERIDEWAARAEPEIVLMHLGTNDIGSGQDISETANEIRQIIQRLRAYNPRIHVLVAAIIPVAHAMAEERIRLFNIQLAALAEELDTTSSRVVLVDQFTGFDARQDTYDGVHPNGKGDNKMSQRWFGPLESLLQTEGKQR